VASSPGKIQYQSNKRDRAGGKFVPISVTAHQAIGRAQKAPVTGVVVSGTVLFRLATKPLGFYCGAQRLDFPAEEGQKRQSNKNFKK
jgi:hypothetical protein